MDQYGWFLLKVASSIVVLAMMASRKFQCNNNGVHCTMKTQSEKED